MSTRGLPWLLIVVVMFCAPLFLNLAGTDVQGDEAIYSFAVDRVLETREWLVPKASPVEDMPFLEKPPVKFWITAAPIRAGILPLSEFSLRITDALFGAAAFLYVFALGVELVAPVAGAIAVLILFTYTPLLFDHGLRTNGMDAALVLAYAGGVYHYLRWQNTDVGDAAVRHAVAVGGWVVLGLMTKFVAVAFLPLILLAG
jgi:4-amino-4-deoxy-L-arabinose transferase-like glycosyltransferase